MKCSLVLYVHFIWYKILRDSVPLVTYVRNNMKLDGKYTGEEKVQPPCCYFNRILLSSRCVFRMRMTNSDP